VKDADRHEYEGDNEHGFLYKRYFTDFTKLLKGKKPKSRIDVRMKHYIEEQEKNEKERLKKRALLIKSKDPNIIIPQKESKH
jgi:hypothetical protein